MNPEISFNSINALIARKSPVQETLRAITLQMLKRESVALARIWLIEKGDICETCVMRADCPNQNRCLHLTASDGRSLNLGNNWSGIEGRFKRFPIGVRKIGHVAESGESVFLDNLRTSESTWIADQDWINEEKIEGFAAHPLKFQDDILGVIGIFSRKNISQESF